MIRLAGAAATWMLMARALQSVGRTLIGLVSLLRSAALLSLMQASAVSAEDKIAYCYQAKIEMPSLEEHRSWLEGYARYGPETAAEYYEKAKEFGSNFLEYQVHYQSHVGGSWAGDIVRYNGISEAKEQQVLADGSCDFPVIYLVGLKPISIKGRALYVSESRGLYSIVSLGTLKQSRRPFQIKLVGSSKTICRDFRRGSYLINEQPCLSLSSYFKR